MICTYQRGEATALEAVKTGELPAGTAELNRDARTELLLPSVMTGIVALELAFGVCGRLLWGFYAALALTGLLCAVALVFLCAGGRAELGRRLRLLLSPGMLLFLILAAALVYIDYGMLPSVWDEFSHWADSAKFMTLMDDFITNPASESWFPSYPPGMALMQYFTQRLYLLVRPASRFVDWLLYYTYQLYALAFLMPFVPRDWSKRPLRSLLVTLSLLLSFCCMFTLDVFILRTTYIDPFLGVVLGCGMAMLFTCEDRGPAFCAYIYSAVFILVLSKAAGLLLGALLAAFFIAALFTDRPAAPGRTRKSLLAAAASFLPYLLWKLERDGSAISQSFSSKDFSMDLATLFRVVTHTEGGYYQAVHDSYYTDLLSLNMRAPVPMPVWLFLLLCLALLLLLRRGFAVSAPAAAGARRLLPVSAVVTLAAYVVGLCYTFVFGFTADEAMGHAGLGRYLCVILLALWMLVMILSGRLACRSGRFPALLAASLLLTLMILPYGDIGSSLTRRSVRDSRDTHAQYQAVCDNVVQLCPGEGARVYVVCQNSYGPAYLQTKYFMRPNTVTPLEDYAPMRLLTADGAPMTAEQWQTELLESYDFAALFRMDESFEARYGSLFAEGSAIERDAVYIVNRDSGLLEKYS